MILLDLHYGNKTDRYLFCLSLISRVKLQTARVELCTLHRMACLGIIGAISTTPAAAVEAPPGLPVHLLFEVELLLDCINLPAVD